MTEKRVDNEKSFVGFRLQKHDLERLDDLAEREERSRSGMLRRIVRAAMAEA